MDIVITYGKEQHTIPIEPTDTLADLKLKIEELTSIQPPHQKLIHKLIKPNATNNDQVLIVDLLPPNSKILVMGTTQRGMQQIEKESRILEIRKKRETDTSSKRATTQSPHKEYTFLSLKPLPEFPDHQQALQILAKLRDDPGIQSLMSNHKWKVGELIELHPAHQTILGYNRNRGQTIAVRLRTDDLKGFRHLSDVRKVLIHELAHM
jgi:hypothetical protein